MQRLLLASFGCWLAGSTCLMAAPAEFPYKAYVIGDEVQVRSGPGEDYYPTDKLRRGDEVEVYRHDPGGWFAIRPPEGSFTWVASRYLDMQQDRLAAINSDRVSARVGSRLSDSRDVVQVRLNKGELVEVLETKPGRDSGGEKTTWCKIAPPSGEFRWVFGRYVDLDSPREGIRRPRSSHADNASPHGSSRSLKWNASAGRYTTAEVSPPYGESGDELADGRFSSEEFLAELNDIELELSLLLSEDPAVWSFGQLRPRATALVEQAETAVQRGRARALANKIAKCEDIKRRSEIVGSIQHNAQRREEALVGPSLGPTATTAAERTASADDRFDGTGRLTRVISAAPGAPKFALVEPNGAVRCYVSPAPGVNLQHYIGQDVGVSGVRGYMPEQRAQHIMAKHISVLDDTQMR